MGDKPEVGFQYGVEGDQALLSTIRALRDELKQVQNQQRETASSAEVLQRAWRGLVELAGAIKLAEFARDVFDTAVNLGKLSQITGVSSATLSVYYKAATDVGVAHEAVDKGITKLARSFVQLQQGNSAAAAGFRLLHLTAKDFIGLSPDEKVRKVGDAFATMKDGPEKAAAAIALFGKAGAQLIPVLDQLGGEEFAKIRDQAERLGLIFNNDMVEGALRAKAALADLKGIAEGATAQFETGLLPALASTADAMAHTITGTSGLSNGFKTLGELAGKALAYIAETFILLGLDAAATGQQLVEIFTLAWDESKIGAKSLLEAFSQAAAGDFLGALSTLRQGTRDVVSEYTDAVGRVHAIRENERAEAKKAHDELFNNTNPRQLPKATGEPGDVKGADLTKNLGRAEASGLKQQAQDELTFYREHAKRLADEDKRAYDQGLLSLEQYFNRRREAIKGEFDAEQKALGVEKSGLQDLLEKTQGESAKTPQQELAKKQALLQLKQQIAHVDAEATVEEEKRLAALARNEDDRVKAKQEHLLKELEAQKKLADLEGDRAKSAQLANQIEDLQLRTTLQQLGQTEAEINRFLAQYGAARSVRTGGDAAKQDFGNELSSFDNRKAAIEAQAAAGPLAGGIGQIQSERELKDLYAQEIPLLEQKVQKLREQAALAQTGSDLQLKLIKEADDEAAKIQKMRLEMGKLTNTWKTEVQNAAGQMSRTITTGFNGWLQGSQKFGAAMKQMWNSIVMTALTSIENITAKQLEQYVILAAAKKVMKFLHIGSGEDDKIAQSKQVIQADAGQAAADVFVQAIEGIPFPANLVAAPVLAATTEAEVMGLGSASSAAGGAGFAAGGYVARRMLGGGYLRGPGSSTSDSIPAMLSDREYVVSAKGVNSVGVETLDMINRGALSGAFLPPIRHSAPYTAHGFSHYASGGIARSLGSPGGAGNGTTVHNHNTIQASSIDSRDFRDHIDDHMDYIADGLKARMRNFRF